MRSQGSDDNAATVVAAVPALIPYWEPAVYHLGPIPIDPWATLTCIGFVVGLEVARARGIKLGLDTRDVVDGAVFIVAMGFLFGHLVHVIAYNPHLMEKDGAFDLATAAVALAKVWAGFSSNGGFLGAIVGTIAWFTWIRPRAFWIHADNGMYCFPFGYVFGRLGCFSVHDHIGVTVEDAPFFLKWMALDFPEPLGPRLDMGGVEALWMAIIAATFFVVNRKVKGYHGKFMVLWCLMYSPVRFGLDFLRAQDIQAADVRWLGLTPAQFGSLLMFTAGVGVAIYLFKRGPEAPSEDEPPEAPATA